MTKPDNLSHAEQNAKGAIPRKKYEQKLGDGWAQANAVFFWAKTLACPPQGL